MSYEGKDLEKKDYAVEAHASDSDVVKNEYYDETLKEPDADKTLHRGLKARQISMIAVRCPFTGRCTLILKQNSAWWRRRNGSYYRVWNRSTKRWTTW